MNSTTNAPTTIVLGDDHKVILRGLRAVLDAQPGLAVVGEASDGLKVAALAERLKPDVLVLDLMMPGLSGFDVTRRVTKRLPKTRVVILTMYSSEAHVVEALRSGAMAYVVKDASADELVTAIREASAGRRFLSAPFSNDLIETYLKRPGGTDPYETLTPREREVLHLVAEGLTSSEIAARLFISPRTAESHRANLMRKLGLRSRTDLVRFAFQRGIVPLESSGAPLSEEE
ncbi:MAG: response regulator transcription factor [Candidatus Eisenbacteria bacterium]|uniref:Response regulator transcription factor n=1 Tax=Eiseniibacteriota bacterium TaxID=2212470 RepID=A0A538S925_UNCEI|nr:MAG: response regulator transcription factor [Candidatus Eisenbacteria bacterium]TMQ57143.1 MAG: response regulator transcription factor [Candidatus Eisenbacteria bacterium]